MGSQPQAGREGTARNPQELRTPHRPDAGGVVERTVAVQVPRVGEVGAVVGRARGIERDVPSTRTVWSAPASATAPHGLRRRAMKARRPAPPGAEGRARMDQPTSVSRSVAGAVVGEVSPRYRVNAARSSSGEVTSTRSVASLKVEKLSPPSARKLFTVIRYVPIAVTGTSPGRRSTTESSTTRVPAHGAAVVPVTPLRSTE